MTTVADGIDTQGAPTFEDLLSTLPCDVLREGIWLQLSQGSRAAMRCTSKAVRHACEAWMCYGITISLPFDSNLKIKGRRKKKKGRQFLDGMMQKLRLTGEREEQEQEVHDPLVARLTHYMARVGRLRSLRFDAHTHAPRGLAALRTLLDTCPDAAGLLQEIELMGMGEHQLPPALQQLRQLPGLRHVTIRLQEGVDLRKVATQLARYLPHLQSWGVCSNHELRLDGVINGEVFGTTASCTSSNGKLDSDGLDEAVGRPSSSRNPSRAGAAGARGGAPPGGTDLVTAAGAGSSAGPLGPAAAAAVTADEMLSRLVILRTHSSLQLNQLSMLATISPRLKELGLASVATDGAATTCAVLTTVRSLHVSSTTVATQQLAEMLRVFPAITHVQLNGALAVNNGLDAAELQSTLAMLAACIQQGGSVTTAYSSQASNVPSPLVQLDGPVLSVRRMYHAGEALAESQLFSLAGGIGFVDMWADQWHALRDCGPLAARITAHAPALRMIVFDTPNYRLEGDTWSWLAQLPHLEHLVMVWAPLGDAGLLAQLMTGKWPQGPRVDRTLRVTLVRHAHRSGPCVDERQLVQLLAREGPDSSALLNVVVWPSNPGTY